MKKRIESALLCALLLIMLLLSACGGAEKAKDADLNAVYARMEEKLALPAMSAMSDRQLERYYGIDVSACPQHVAMQCDDGLRVDEIWLIQAADEEAAAQLLSLAQSRIDQLAAETENYLPDQFAVVKNSRALRIGSYVALLISPDAAQMEELFRGAF